MLFEEKTKGYLTFFSKALLIVVIIPFLILSYFPTPSADDFCFATQVINNGFIQTQIERYHTVGGRFFATGVLTSIMGLMNFIGGKILFVEKYWILSTIILLILWKALFIFIKSLFSRQLSSKEISWAAFTLFVIFVVRVPSTAQGFYWLPASITYTLANALTLFLLSLLFSSQNFTAFSRIKKSIYILTCILLTAAVIGSNETIMLILLIILFFGTLYTSIHKHPNAFLWKTVLVTGIVCAIIVFSAPGNSARLSYFPQKLQIGTSIISALKIAVIYFLAWSRNITVIGASIILLSFSSTHSNRFNSSKLTPHYFVIFIVLWLGTIFMSLLPAFVSMGHRPPLRTRNTIYLIYMLGWFYSIFMFGSTIFHSHVQKISKSLMPIGQIIMIAGLIFTGNFLRGVKDLTRAPAYKIQVKKRTKQIQHAIIHQATSLITVSAYKNIPKTITFDDIEVDPKNWKNQCCSNFYSLDSINISP